MHLFPLFWRKMRVRRYMTENNKAQKLMKIGKTYKTALSAATAADRAASRIHHNQHPPSSRPQARGRCVSISGPGVKPQWESRGQRPLVPSAEDIPVRRGRSIQTAGAVGDEENRNVPQQKIKQYVLRRNCSEFCKIGQIKHNQHSRYASETTKNQV